MIDTRTRAEHAFVLHVRPYRETSAIVSLVTLEHGRIDVVARGVRGSRRKRADALAPFVRLQVAWTGRTQLRTLTAFEPVEHRWLSGRALFAGMYLNELLLRLLRPDDPHPELFGGYDRTVSALAEGVPIEPELRRFEKLLLRECGYELVFDRDADNGEPVAPGQAYCFEPELGFRRVGSGSDGGYPGALLLAIAADRFETTEVRRAAKRILRQALAPHLGDRPLHSRALFRVTR